jgi:hypothetical protein
MQLKAMLSVDKEVKILKGFLTYISDVDSVCVNDFHESQAIHRHDVTVANLADHRGEG